ncbi:TRAP transporter solute receptor, TAXI family [Clostridiales bacterium 1_7_47FAA]|uniref:TAXI family TRAP transporter solute-binding subunit n=1 Tax=Enterocloster hominis (ex Hitch et al. 2024) TaxID=1917870 RepID=A0ABV1DB64_9FIRM|nr:TRAP transporter solute receptor, TAXI family [Clostridiales bacterium 1_7_47FAA]
MKKLITILLAGMMTLSLAACGGTGAGKPADTQPGGTTEAKETAAAGSGKAQFYSFGAGGSGGTWYTMVGGIISLFNDNIPNSSFSVSATGGSGENATRLYSGDDDFGMVYDTHIYQAYSGTGDFEGKQNDNLQVLCQIYDSCHYFVVRADSGIETLSDLEGKKIAYGAAGSMTNANSRMVFDTLGINVSGQDMSYSDAASALKDGTIDCLGQGGAPASGIVELAATIPIKIIPISDDEIAKLQAVSPFCVSGVLPANTYEGQTEDVPSFYNTVFWCANKNVDPDVVYNALDIAFQNVEYLGTVHVQWSTLCNMPETVESLGAVYHPGAEKYWSEHSK